MTEGSLAGESQKTAKQSGGRPVFQPGGHLQEKTGALPGPELPVGADRMSEGADTVLSEEWHDGQRTDRVQDEYWTNQKPSYLQLFAGTACVKQAGLKNKG